MRSSEPRPIIKVKKDLIDYLYLYGSYFLTVSMWFFVFYHYQSLPDDIPVRYGMNGMPDGFGHKSTLFFVPVLVSLMVIFLNVLSLFPNKFNYLREITTENAEWQYKKALKLIRYLQFFIPVIFSYIVYKEVQGAVVKKSSLGFWFIPVLIFGIIIPTVVNVYQSLIKK